jgi:hypothetical protein
MHLSPQMFLLDMSTLIFSISVYTTGVFSLYIHYETRDFVERKRSLAMTQRPAINAANFCHSKLSLMKNVLEHYSFLGRDTSKFG